MRSSLTAIRGGRLPPTSAPVLFSASGFSSCPSAAIANLDRFRTGGRGGELISEAEFVEDAAGVGRNLNPGTRRFRLRAAFKDACRNLALGAGEGGGEAADPAAGDYERQL